MRRRAFTLIELLVVISIIALLSAMILPALASARRQARVVQCAATVRSWTQACLVYASDHYDVLPNRDLALWPNVVGARGRRGFEDYGMNIASAFCTEAAVRPAQRPYAYQYAGGSMGYSYYGRLNWGGPIPRSPWKATDTRDQFGRMTFLIADVNRFTAPGLPLHTNHADPSEPMAELVIDPFLTLYVGIPRGINQGFTDGHAEWLRYDRLDLNRYYHTGVDFSFHWII